MDRAVILILLLALVAFGVWAWWTGRVGGGYPTPPPGTERPSLQPVRRPRTGSAGGSERRDAAGVTRWAGRWHNRRANTSGRLECELVPKGNGRWTGHFTGEYRGREFEYATEMIGVRQGNRIEFRGSASVDRHAYEWTGQATDRRLTGQFRSRDRNHGDFSLTRQ